MTDIVQFLRGTIPAFQFKVNMGNCFWQFTPIDTWSHTFSYAATLGLPIKRLAFENIFNLNG